MIEQLFSPELVHATGWTLVHSLWQAAAFALGLGLVLLALRKYSARARYYVSIAMLGGFFLTVGLTFASLYGADVTTASVVIQEAGGLPASIALQTDLAPATAQNNYTGNSYEANFLERVTSYYNEHLPLIVTLWLLGVLVLQLRFIGQLVFLQRLKNYGAESFSAKYAPMLRELEEKMGLQKAVRYLTSFRVTSPFTVGWLQPVVMFPATLLEQLAEPELRTILAHELAHVKRHDFLVNLGQTLFCILFFYHPAVWWMSARIEEEREHCCDDLAIAVTGERVGYAKTLIQLKESELTPALAMAFKGRGRGFQGRVKRLLTGYLGTGTYGEGFTSAVIIFGIMALAITLSSQPDNELRLAGNDFTEASENSMVPLPPAPPPPPPTAPPAAPEPPVPNAEIVRIETEVEDEMAANRVNRHLDINEGQNEQFTQFLRAVDEGDQERVRYFLSLGVDVNGEDADGWTPLMVAASEHQEATALLLIERGANVNYVNSNGWTALIEAADEDAVDVARLLLSRGAKADVPGTPRSALTMAASEGHPEMITVLVQAGADINALRKMGSPLHAAAEENHLSIVKSLLANGADIISLDGHGRTALHYAAEEGNNRIVLYLLEQGIGVNVVDLHGRTALSYAAEEGNGWIVDYLLEAGATR